MTRHKHTVLQWTPTIAAYDEHKKLVADTIAEFPERFGLRGFPGDVFRCSATDSYVNDAGSVTIYVERLSPQRESLWLAHSKGSPAEVRAELVTIQRDHARQWLYVIVNDLTRSRATVVAVYDSPSDAEAHMARAGSATHAMLVRPFTQRPTIGERIWL